MESKTPSIHLTFTHRGATHPLSLLPESTLAYLQERLEELTSVPQENQKLLYKGKKTLGPDATISDAGLKDGMKVQLIGPTAEELGGLKAAESEHQRKERILRERAQRAPVKVRSTAPSSSTDSQYTFHRIEPLPHLPNPESARNLLTKLANDPAIRHVMRKHQFSVGVLTELAPHEQPHLLGLNVNAGQAIKLRLRTDRYDGFRLFSEVRRVLCHELTHNVWGDHDNNFKELNSTLNKEVAEFERAQAAGAHQLGGGGFGPPQSALEAEAQEYALGGSYTLGGPGASSPGDSPEERRRKVLEATMNRLRKEEEELEDRCGTAGHS
ncbi:WLM-domain-containing protein [Dichomitus squalens]|uniref:WLM-domain-containing protein n=1 Tax=Dichomitus squalens TaxID=114155 RepID=A0A4Q9N4J2_9APHY|nr:WLM-domain-containing protein [Dichomitus squalens]